MTKVRGITLARIASVLAMGTLVLLSVNIMVEVNSSSEEAIRSANSRQITFSGREWLVKSGFGGPGPNQWSDSADNVWVDTSGQLHLRLTYVNGLWYAAEVSMLDALSYGQYVFYVASRVDLLDKNVAAGLFVYQDDSNEIDIEFSRFGGLTTNSQYVVQPPPYTSGNLYRFSTQLNGDYSTHRFVWAGDSISFRSLHGHYSEPPDRNYVIAEWQYGGSYIPHPDAERVHINLWLNGGTPPSDGREAELIVTRFEFVPYVLHAPIFIQGNNMFTRANGVVGGSGTADDPYLIEGWKIDASQAVVTGIMIFQTSAHFVIRNVYVHSGFLADPRPLGGNDGIRLSDASNGIIENSTIANNGDGIFANFSNNVLVAGNTIINSSRTGIMLSGSSGVFISGNDIRYSGGVGGISALNSNRDTIFGNRLYSNVIGVLLQAVNNTSVFHNSFLNNSQHGGQDYFGYTNMWDNGYPSGGNYWSDYGGSDNCSGPDQDICPDPDGIGDVLYQVPACVGRPCRAGYVPDRYPLVDPYGSPAHAPSAPQNPSASGQSAQIFVSWQGPFSDRGSPIRGYNLYRSTSSGAETLYQILGVALSYVDTSVECQTSYYYQVSAINAIGEGLQSAEVSAGRLCASTPSASKPSVDVDQSVTFSTTFTGGSGGYSYSWSGLPPGCSSSSAANLVCHPAAAGSFLITVAVTDSNGFSALSSPLPYTVYPDPSIPAPAASRSVDVGQSVTFSASASGGSGGYDYTWLELPTGCALANTPALTCTPTGPGTFSISIRATDSNGYSVTSPPLTYTVHPVPSVAVPSASQSAIEVGQSVAFSASASGGSGGYSYSWSGLPSGCQSSNAATLTCTASAPGTYAITVRVTDSNGYETDSAVFTFTVRSSNPTTIFGLDPVIFYGTLGGVVALVAIGAAVALVRRRKATIANQVSETNLGFL